MPKHSPAVVPAATPAPDLATLAAEINELHEQANRSFEAAVTYAYNCGRKLLRAKDGMKHGDWMNWCEANVRIHRNTRQTYMQMAREPSVLEFASLGIAGALEAATGRSKAHKPVHFGAAGAEPESPALRGEAVRRLRDWLRRENGRMADDPEAADFAWIGAGGVLRVVAAVNGDEGADPAILDQLGQETVARVTTWCTTRFERAMDRLVTWPLYLASHTDEQVVEIAADANMEDLRTWVVTMMVELDRPTDAVLQHLTTPNRRALEHALRELARMLARERPDDVIAARRRWETEMAA
jgi:hypothetical protein